MDTSQRETVSRFKNLRLFNAVMAVLHFAQGVAMVMLSSDFSLPITTSFVEFDTTTKLLTPSLQTAFDVRLGLLVASFLFLSSLAHLLLTFPGIYTWYVRNLKKGINTGRWIEYSFSSSIMIVAIAMLAGIYDGIALLGLFGLNIMMILFGWIMEVHNQTTQKTNWLSFIFGSFAGLIPWIAIAISLFNAGEGDMKAPTFVYWIFVSLFLFFNVFAINMVLQYKKVGKWQEYLYSEKVYIVLSLIAKSLLAWQVWAGTLRPV